MTERNENNEQIASSNLMADQEVPVQQGVSTASKDVDDDGVKKVHFAGFWMRFWAYLADLLVIGSLNRILIHPIFKFYEGTDDLWFSAEGFLTGVIFFLYFVLMTKFLNQTLGKMIFGLKVVALKEEKKNISWGTILFRELIGRYISKVTWIGYLLAGLLPKKQALHDVFADTGVVLVRR
ncbi:MULTISPECIES: RDD family protein [Peribacillus]|uniref:RDD family protein n=1 Tax=Peribacillus TaxID=2675229 RepID=UPI001F4EE790|nr:MULTISPECIES: RDD family protein [unclassified Peribacillus]MCK1981725.1 RDD family protein [Peribacillus sp. Aquil_B1]MCK2009553.1 RDD family protein [Peribacillus sp. Aquil_B8]